MNSVFSQSLGDLKIEKRLKVLFENEHFKKCNRVAKKYIRKSKVGDQGLNSSHYYAALSYIHYPFWNWTKRRILHGEPFIMNTKPLNYIDSTLKYNDLYLKDLDKGFITKSRWQEELFEPLEFEITYGFANQLILHKYPEYNQDPQLIYDNHKEECDAILAWKWKLYELTNEYFPIKSLESYVEYHGFKNDFLGLNFTVGQLDTIYNHFPSYMDLHDNNVGIYSSLLPQLMEIDTFQFYRFLHLIEAADTTFSNSNYFDWKRITTYFDPKEKTTYYEWKSTTDKAYLPIWKPLEKVEDAGTFFVTDSIRTNKIPYSVSYAISFDYTLYPGDTLKFHATDDNRFVITNLKDLQQLSGSGTDTVIIQFTDPSACTFSKQREWEKRELAFMIRTNRGNNSFEFVYRYKYVE
jgi:hypothetical protein